VIILFSYHFYALDDNIDTVQSPKSSLGLGLVVGLRGCYVLEIPHWPVLTDIPVLIGPRLNAAMELWKLICRWIKGRWRMMID
jgi:hypothetical protein